jgi:hypothetical protein
MICGTTPGMPTRLSPRKSASIARSGLLWDLEQLMADTPAETVRQVDAILSELPANSRLLWERRSAHMCEAVSARRRRRGRP